MVIRGVVFDLDDTLYLERDYVRSGFFHVAKFMGRSEVERRDLDAWLGRAFETGIRGDTFDRLLAAKPALSKGFSVGQLVAEYRAHRPVISMLPGMDGALERLRDRGVRLGVLSDGRLESQLAKADALHLDKWFDPVLLTASHVGFAKPATDGFEWIGNAWQIAGAELAYVADNPLKDFIAPRRLGWLTVRLRLPEQLRYGVDTVVDREAPDLEVRGTGDLIDLLERTPASNQESK